MRDWLEQIWISAFVSIEIIKKDILAILIFSVQPVDAKWLITGNPSLLDQFKMIIKRDKTVDYSMHNM